MSQAAGALAAVAISHKTASYQELSAYALDEAGVRRSLRRLRDRFDEAAIIATCSRTEIVVRGGSDSEDAPIVALKECDFPSADAMPNGLPRGFRELHGTDVVTHLFSVASGADSAFLGEREVLSQVRRAAEIARSEDAIHGELDRLMSAAVATGRKVRKETEISHWDASLGPRIFDMARAHLGDLTGVSLLIVGAGAAAASALRSFSDESLGSIHIANRSAERAEKLASKFDATPVLLNQVAESMRSAQIIVFATPAKDRLDILDSVDVERPAASIIFDLGPPSHNRSVAERYAYRPLDEIYRSDADVQKIQRRALKQAQAIIDDETSRFVSWLERQAVLPVVTALVDRVESISRSELEVALRKLGKLDPAQMQAVERLASGITKKILHRPLVNLARGADQIELADATSRLFDLNPSPNAPTEGDKGGVTALGRLRSHQ